MGNTWKKHMPLYAFALPGMLYFILFKYVPIWGLLLAFQEYSPFRGFFQSDWVGLANFKELFAKSDFIILLNNTLLLSFYNLVFYFPLVIVLSLLLNDLRFRVYKKIVQSVLYLPHFVSWVIIAGITIIFFGPSGIINQLVEKFGGSDLSFMTSTEWFRPLMVLQHIWRDMGWGTIILLAALVGINPELYDAANVDGAGKLRMMWSISLPSIRSTIVVLVLLQLGTSLDSNFYQIFLSENALNHAVANVFDLYVYQVGLLQGNFSMATTVGLFKSVASLLMVLVADYFAKILGEEGIF
ncbi:sugar ABC transporter permease [Paenibacillus psychroresistens]|uniref:Sugar ABC transporter permease n=1 Tax=Paenibacillus psychroresistens TaxID=1778678 RepID=A0A6B8RSJ3_9BACL|nr:ABC transporter permease subunit [Paenibacillus psychroresistens]QGQ98433.1 sugar ABC transporter permease [Paenibacillus psychroresistens]